MEYIFGSDRLRFRKFLESDLQFLADEWGMNDTEFREGVIEWIQSNHFTENALFIN